jgi:hypothetical protein
LVWWWVASPLCRRIIAAAAAIVGTLTTPARVRVDIPIRRRLFWMRVDCRWRRFAALTLGTHFRQVLRHFICIWWRWWFLPRTWRLALWLLVH